MVELDRGTRELKGTCGEAAKGPDDHLYLEANHCRNQPAVDFRLQSGSHRALGDLAHRESCPFAALIGTSIPLVRQSSTVEPPCPGYHLPRSRSCRCSSNAPWTVELCESTSRHVGSLTAAINDTSGSCPSRLPRNLKHMPESAIRLTLLDPAPDTETISSVQRRCDDVTLVGGSYPI